MRLHKKRLKYIHTLSILYNRGKDENTIQRSLKRQFNQGDLGMSVHTGISYKRPKKKKPKTKWERFKEWLKELL